MRSTVIVALYNEGNLLLQTLRSVAAVASKLKHEPVIVNEQSRDGSVELAEQRGR